MKFDCDRKMLEEAVLKVQHAVSVKSSYPALEGILLEAKSGKLRLCGYDLSIGITTEFPATILEPGSVVMGAKLFCEIIRRLPEQNVHLETDKKNLANIRSGESKFSIAGIPAEEYPELPQIEKNTNFTLPADILKSMIRQTIFAVSQSDQNPIHTGVLFETDRENVRMVAVDGYRLAIREEPVKNMSKCSFVVPGKTLKEIVNLINDKDKEIKLTVGQKHIQIQIGNYTVISRLLEGNFLNYRAAVQKSSSTKGIVSVPEFISSLQRVSLLVNDRIRSPIRCFFRENEICLSCITEMGRADDRIPAKLEGDPVEIGFNSSYLLDALQNSECDEVKLCMNSPIDPLEIMPEKGNSFLFLVLPVRLKSGGNDGE